MARAVGGRELTRASAPRILIVVNAEWYFWSHRLPIARGLLAQGCDVVVAAAEERGLAPRIRAEGIRFIGLRLHRSSTGLLSDIRTIVDLWRLYRRERPDLVHHVAIKPVLYGSIAARLASVPAIVNAVPGLGYMFLGRGLTGALRRAAARIAYRTAFASARATVIFQNSEDRDAFIAADIVPPGRTVVIRGSGVDLEQFACTPMPHHGEPLVVLPSRLLWDKGVGEFVEASRLLKARGTCCRIVLVGAPDPHNPKSIPEAQLARWQDEGLIEWWGLRDDMPAVLAQSSVVVLPSYREGVPKSLLEAAAVGRPMIASDVPGCREIVIHDETGLLVPPRDSVALADAIDALVRDRERRERMSRAARRLAEQCFSQESVVQQTFDVYRGMLGPKWTS